MTTQHSAAPPRTAVATMLEPRSIAIVGISAKPEASSRRLLDHLFQDNYAGDIHLVGRSGGEIVGRPVLAGVDELPDGVDLALLILPAGAVKDAVKACVRRGVRVAVVYAAGFAELGDAGRAEQAEIGRLAREGGLALAGPNCIGFINYVNPLNTIFIPQIPVRKLAEETTGALAVLAQSGGLMAMVREGLRARGVPISYCVSTGNEAGLTLADYLDHLAEDPATSGVVVYAEDIRDPRGLLGAVRKMRANGKVLVLMHTGRSERGKVAAASHTGALAADYGVMKTLLTHTGACVVESLEELVDVGEILARYPRPPAADTAVVTTSGAFCSIALDALGDLGADVPELSPHTVETLTARMPSYMKPGNPLDLGTVTATDPELYHDGLAAVLADDRIGSVVVAVPFVSAAANLRMLEEVTRAASGQPKPVAIGLLGDVKPLDEDLKSYAKEHGMVVSGSPERIIRAMAAVTRYGRTLARARGTVAESADVAEPSGLGPGARPEWAGKRFVAAQGIPVPDGELATTVEQAVEIAAKVGYPVAAKAQAADLQHKTEAGGLVLGIPDESALRAAWDRLTERVAEAGVRLFDGVLVEAMAPKGVELMVGAKRHPEWGPVVMVGLGGVWVEAIGDVRLIPPDLSEAEIVGELRALRSAKLLGDFRGSRAVDLDAVARVVSTVGRLMVAHPEIAELDINPLLARPDGATALDVLIACSPEDTRR
ncbi:acetate--CoA ligase family protein [Amycolatopsis taiwanensis]|uniref:6-carboxyhexanoate--CoA ligase n=1 Tax=Amycolatopsis taiwanensis TaxID=342230 RepID=A0A9W6VG08_9PSEU|nr:acetate--CoA ligase family protein [Amycolatopsis taiwanensis]GLY70223.1 6-carboxyhexanoate--CoA ligase [Amycolatopsis taiwanensis]